ncbi:DUF6634 family protein [Agrobacterium pusense]|uniref:DUF6634 family protein n=1 Tax=Agrobacterium pusense TaxID=648995 RepID=UPI000D3BC169|nr:hypothetical protein DBL06_25350 [Agrobacterium pusense]
MIEHFNGDAPTNDEMRAAPVLYRWQLQETRSGVEVHGIVQGHPHLPDNEWIRTSDLVQIDPSSKPYWLRTESRLYHLGKRMGRTEIHIRKELQASGYALTRDQVTISEQREFHDVFRQRRKHLDEIERILLLLVRTNRIDRARAIKLHKIVLPEISR